MMKRFSWATRLLAILSGLCLGTALPVVVRAEAESELV